MHQTQCVRRGSSVLDCLDDGELAYMVDAAPITSIPVVGGPETYSIKMEGFGSIDFTAIDGGQVIQSCVFTPWKFNVLSGHDTPFLAVLLQLRCGVRFG